MNGPAVRNLTNTPGWCWPTASWTRRKPRCVLAAWFSLPATSTPRTCGGTCWRTWCCLCRATARFSSRPMADLKLTHDQRRVLQKLEHLMHWARARCAVADCLSGSPYGALRTSPRIPIQRPNDQLVSSRTQTSEPAAWFRGGCRRSPRAASSSVPPRQRKHSRCWAACRRSRFSGLSWCSRRPPP